MLKVAERAVYTGARRGKEQAFKTQSSCCLKRQGIAPWGSGWIIAIGKVMEK